MSAPTDKTAKSHGLSTRRRRWSFRLAAIAASLLAVLLVGEAVCRLLDVRGFHAPRTRDWHHAMAPREAWERNAPGFKFQPYATFELNYDSNPTGYFNERNGLVYHTNRFGLRGLDFTLKKDPGVTRILILGDSFVFGEGVRFEHTTGEHLERLLNARGQERFEVINAGLPGWDTTREIAFLEHKGIEFEPDIVLVGYVLNDAASGVDLWENVLQTYQKRALRRSYFISYLYGLFARHTLTRAYIDEMAETARDPESLERHSLCELSRGRKLAEQMGARFVVYIYPLIYDLSDSHPFTDLHTIIVDYCQKHGIEVLDLLPHYKGHEAEALWAHPHSDPHPNSLGHEIAAEALAAFLTTR
jgi:hypothetical protein